MIEANTLHQAQAQLDRCRRLGAEVYLWRGEIHITGAKPSGQQQAKLRKHEEAIRRLLGDDGKPHPWAVSQLPGGTLLYQHPHFDTGDRKPVTEDKRAATMPFGKYPGAPLDVLQNDRPYAEWLLRQPWFGERYPSHRQYVREALAIRQTDAEGPNAA